MGTADETADARWRRPGREIATSASIEGREVEDATAVEIEVFATGTSEWREIERPPTDDEILAALSGQIHRTGGAVRDAMHHARDFHARPGHRPGYVAPATASSRRGGGTDIVRPALVDPTVACELALNGSLFVEPLRHLTVRGAAHRAALTWDVTVTTRRRRYPATLHILASPSMVVTVIELVPACRVHRHRRRFVDEGVAALDELARRLESAARRGASQRNGSGSSSACTTERRCVERVSAT